MKFSATEGNLTDAQNYVKRLTAEAEAAESEQSLKKVRNVETGQDH